LGPSEGPQEVYRSMSITKLKTIGSWQPPRGRVIAAAMADGPEGLRGRVITGMLTGADPPPSGRTVTHDPCVGRGR
jgi:hypothetical protein